MIIQGKLTLILKGEGSLTGLTSCPYRIYWLGISCISACKVFFQHQNNLVQTSKDRRSAVPDPSPFRIKVSVPWLLFFIKSSFGHFFHPTGSLTLFRVALPVLPTLQVLPGGRAHQDVGRQALQQHRGDDVVRRGHAARQVQHRQQREPHRLKLPAAVPAADKNHG